MESTESIDALVTTLEWIETGFEYDVLVPGHTRLGNRETVREVREYLRALEGAIRAARAQGHADNSEEMVGSVRTALAPRYGNWANFGSQSARTSKVSSASGPGSRKAPGRTTEHVNRCINLCASSHHFSYGSMHEDDDHP